MNTRKTFENGLNGTVTAGTWGLGLVLVSGVAQATDLQIYASPSAGKKTIVMMLDTSGSMETIDKKTSGCTSGSDTGGDSVFSYTREYCASPASSSSASTKKYCTPVPNSTSPTEYRCYRRVDNLKDGMFAFLNSTDAKLNPIRVGLGNFSSNGDDKTGQILVPAAALGDGSTANTAGSQRYKLKQAIANLTSGGYTPSAHAYAEAAAYLMGTTTVVLQALTYTIKSYGSALVSTYTTTYDSTIDRYVYDYTYKSYTCQTYGSIDYATGIRPCVTWSGPITTTTGSSTRRQDNRPDWNNKPSISGRLWTQTNLSNPRGVEEIYGNSFQSVAPPEPVVPTQSGIVKSKNNDANQNQIMVDGSVANTALQYRTPLPPTTERVSCDGQGVYFLSDGQPNRSSLAEAKAIMGAALTGSGFTSDFNTDSNTCSGGLSNTASDSAWDCMGEFAKRLYDPSKNPAGVKIQTAFVGFGSDFASTTFTAGTDVGNACALGALSKETRCTGGNYGRGGFYQAASSDDVTKSVLGFLSNLETGTLKPLTTGAVSVPVDPLNPNGFQPFGYLRMMAPDPANPGKLVWEGNLKKYQTISGTLRDGTNYVFDTKGNLNAGTKDLWNNTSTADGGIIAAGGAYSRVPMPTTATPLALRPFFSDIASSNGSTVTPLSAGSKLASLKPTTTLSDPASNALLAKMNSTLADDAPLKDLPLKVKLRILNYFGYDVPLDSTALPSGTNPLPTPDKAFLSMGASIHSLPVQLTYSGTIDTNTGDLTTTRTQSLMYGTTDGGLHVVDGTTGVEQMVFVPAELLDSAAGDALRKGQSGTPAPNYGLDGPWVADAVYDVSGDGSQVTARKMNVYGGLRMGGRSYYGLDLKDPTQPKLKFRIGPTNPTATGDFSRMGQSWSRPTLANIRYNGAVKRVMIVGGGYDTCYEDPRFRLESTGNRNDLSGSSCNNKTAAQGNAVYIVDADSGAKLAEVTYSSGDDRQYLKHSIVSRIATLDRDADGLIDHLYFGDLGGQGFRVDLNNASGTSAADLVTRVTRVLDLSTPTNGGYTTAGDQPRFYEAPTLTIHDEGANTFILMALASGDRSTPLDVTPTVGRDAMLPATALTGRPTNKVYGLIDRDFQKLDLISNATLSMTTQNVNISTLVPNPQTVPYTGSVGSYFFASSASPARNGWYRSLSSDSAGIEKAVNGFRTPGGLKAFEDLIAITGNLLIPVYDPEGTGVAATDPCQPRVVGETNWQKYCLPYGVCLQADGTKDTTSEAVTGFRLDANNKNDNIIGAGIQGIAMGAKTNGNSGTPTPGSCGNMTILGNQAGRGEWSCTRRMVPSRWLQKTARVN